MLKRLLVQNYVLIDSLEIGFNKGLNIITGETGAGKSILLGALSLILGERADKSVLLDIGRKSVIEGAFQNKNKAIKDFFKGNDLDFEQEIILRREISSDGKSRSFINDTPVSLSQLKNLGELLVDIHSQHETLFLRQSKFQLSVLDAFAKTAEDVDSYQHDFYRYLELLKSLNLLEEDEKKSKADQDYYQFLFDELNETGLIEGEQEKLEEEQNTMTHAEEIKGNLTGITHELNGNEDNLLKRITKIQSLIQNASKHRSSLNELNERIKSILIELKDISSEVEQVGDEINFEPSRIEEIQSRLNEIYRLEQKHRAKSISALIASKDDFENKLKSIESLDEKLEDTRQQVQKLRASLIKQSQNISSKRIRAIPTVEKEITKLLSDVNLKNATFNIENELLPEERFTIDGIDQIKFLFSANKGIPQREISKAASGGELSRVMLCIKAAVAKLISLPTIIFDEIDTGISGETAMNVGKVLKDLSERHQLIAITHLPQIAGRGDAHYYVYKETGKQKTAANVKLLTNDERIVEIAKMLSGEKPTVVALENAKELLGINNIRITFVHQ